MLIILFPRLHHQSFSPSPTWFQSDPWGLAFGPYAWKNRFHPRVKRGKGFGQPSQPRIIPRLAKRVRTLWSVIRFPSSSEKPFRTALRSRSVSRWHGNGCGEARSSLYLRQKASTTNYNIAFSFRNQKRECVPWAYAIKQSGREGSLFRAGVGMHESGRPAAKRLPWMGCLEDRRVLLARILIPL